MHKSMYLLYIHYLCAFIHVHLCACNVHVLYTDVRDAGVGAPSVYHRAHARRTKDAIAAVAVQLNS